MNDNMYKKAIADNSDEVFYIISDNTGNIEKLKSDIKYINQAKKISKTITKFFTSPTFFK